MILRSIRNAGLALLSGSILPLAPVYAESLIELWERPIKGDFASSKSSLSLEYCIGSEISEHGPPNVLHGENVTDLWVGRPYAIRINDRQNDRRVTFTASAAYDDRVERIIRGCL